MDSLIAGERNPKTLAQLARARARRKMGGLEEALEGAEFFTPEHAALLAAMLGRINQVNTEIARLSEVIERLLAPFEEQLQQAESMPSWGRPGRPGRHRGDRHRHDPVPHRRPPALLGRPHPAGQPVPARGTDDLSPRRATGTSAACSARPPSPFARPRPAKAPATGGYPAAAAKLKPWSPWQHPAEGLPRAAVQPRRPIRGPRRRLLRQPGQHPPADQPPRRQARRPRLRSHPLPHPRTRARRKGEQPGRLTHNALPTLADP